MFVRVSNLGTTVAQHWKATVCSYSNRLIRRWKVIGHLLHRNNNLKDLFQCAALQHEFIVLQPTTNHYKLSGKCSRGRTNHSEERRRFPATSPWNISRQVKRPNCVWRDVLYGIKQRACIIRQCWQSPSQGIPVKCKAMHEYEFSWAVEGKQP